MAVWRLSRIRGMETAAFDLRLTEHAADIDEEHQSLFGLAYVFLRAARAKQTQSVDTAPSTLLRR